MYSIDYYSFGMKVSAHGDTRTALSAEGCLTKPSVKTFWHLLCRLVGIIGFISLFVLFCMIAHYENISQCHIHHIYLFFHTHLICIFISMVRAFIIYIILVNPDSAIWMGSSSHSLHRIPKMVYM